MDSAPCRVPNLWTFQPRDSKASASWAFNWHSSAAPCRLTIGAATRTQTQNTKGLLGRHWIALTWRYWTAFNPRHQWSASHMKRHFQCAEQAKSPPTSICVTYDTSFTMRGPSKVTLQLHQIVRLPRKMNRSIDPHHIWNVISHARSKQSHPPTSPNTAPATQNQCHQWSAHFFAEVLL